MFKGSLTVQTEVMKKIQSAPVITAAFALLTLFSAATALRANVAPNASALFSGAQMVKTGKVLTPIHLADGDPQGKPCTGCRKVL